MIKRFASSSIKPFFFACAALVLSAGPVSGQAARGFSNTPSPTPGAGTGYSSSAATASSDAAVSPGGKADAAVIAQPAPARRGVRPFSDVALGLKLGTGGIGFEVATPLAQRMNLRSGFSYFSYSTTFITDGLNIDGALKLGNGFATLDLFPFNNSFRISPGLSFHNNNHLNASLLVPGGQTFSLGESGDFTSDPSDPIHGTGAFVFGNNFAPRLTMGFGNMLPRKGGHFSLSTEIGFQYIAQPTVSMSISGQSCVQVAGLSTPACGPVDQTYVQQEQQEIQADITPYRFFPIASLSLGYRFGHAGATVR